jgi:hypothetical protein
MIFASLAYLSLLLTASSSVGGAEKLADFSFEPPFQDVDNSGLRCSRLASMRSLWSTQISIKSYLTCHYIALSFYVKAGESQLESWGRCRRQH